MGRIVDETDGVECSLGRTFAKKTWKTLLMGSFMLRGVYSGQPAKFRPSVEILLCSCLYFKLFCEPSFKFFPVI